MMQTGSGPQDVAIGILLCDDGAWHVAVRWQGRQWVNDQAHATQQEATLACDLLVTQWVVEYGGSAERRGPG